MAGKPYPVQRFAAPPPVNTQQNTLPYNPSPYPPQQSAAYPPQQSAAYPPQQSAAYPPQQSAAYPPQQSAAYPPQQSAAYPSQQPASYPVHNSLGDAYPPPSTQPAGPPPPYYPNDPYPRQPSSYPPQGGYPPQPHMYPQQRAVYPPGVQATGEYDSSARFGTGATHNIPPPPPGVMPNAAQMANMSGGTVIMNQRPAGWFEGHSSGGTTFW